MLVRDSRSPRGRYEDSGPTQDYARIQSIGVGFLPPDGTVIDWHTQSDRSMENRRRIDPTLAERRPPRAPSTGKELLCDRVDCRAPFVTVHPKQIYCSRRCQVRVYKRRARAR